MATLPGTIEGMAAKLLTPGEDLETEAPEAETLEVETEEEETETEEDVETPEGDTETTYKVTVGDEELDLTLEELTKGYLRERDYTQKTMQVAEHRKAAEARLSKLDAAIQQAELLSQVESVDLEQLEQEDPDAYIAHTKAEKAREQKLAELRAAREAELSETAKARAAEEGEKLAAAIPDWLDTATMQADVKLMQKQWAAVGYSDEDVSLPAFRDHRFMVLSRKAALYDKIMSADPGSKKVQDKPKSAKPAAAEKVKPEKVKRAEKAREKAKKTGKMQDAARALEAAINQ